MSTSQKWVNISVFFQDQEPAIKPLPFEGERDTVYTYNECDVCDKVFVLESSWKGNHCVSMPYIML